MPPVTMLQLARDDFDRSTLPVQIPHINQASRNWFNSHAPLTRAPILRTEEKKIAFLYGTAAMVLCYFYASKSRGSTNLDNLLNLHPHLIGSHTLATPV